MSDSFVLCGKHLRNVGMVLIEGEIEWDEQRYFPRINGSTLTHLVDQAIPRSTEGKIRVYLEVAQVVEKTDADDEENHAAE